MLRALLVTSVCLLLASSGVTTAHASVTDDPDTADRIARALAAMPGGVQTGPTTVEWGGGDVELALPWPTARSAVGSCPSDRFCVYSGTNLSGARLSFASCSGYSTAPLGSSVRSLANALPSSYVRAHNASGTLLTTLAPGVQVNTAPAGISEIACVP